MPSELAIKIAELTGHTLRISGQWQKPDGYGGIMVVDKLPEPDTNPADCLELMRYVLTETRIKTVFIDKSDVQFSCVFRGIWLEKIGIETYIGYADTLEHAVTRAALAALSAGQEDKG